MTLLFVVLFSIKDNFFISSSDALLNPLLRH